jgi:TolA-binding protein
MHTMTFSSRTRRQTLTALLRGGVAASVIMTGTPSLWAAPKPPETEKVFRYEYRPSSPDRDLTNYIRFVQKTTPGAEGLKSRYAVGELLLKQNRYDEAAQIFQNLARAPQGDEFFNASVLLRLGDCNMHQGLFPQAAQNFTAVLHGKAKSLIPEATLGLALAGMAMGDGEMAYLRIKELMAFYPNFKSRKNLLLPLGLIHWQMSRYKEALGFFKQDDQNPSGVFFAGLCERSLKMPAESAATFRRLQRDFPGTIWAERARFEVGETFYQAGDYPLSNRSFAELFASKPGEFWENLSLYRMACADMGVKDHAAAQAKLETLYRTSQDDLIFPSVVYLLTESLAELNRIDRALPVLEAEASGHRRTADTVYRLLWARAAVGDDARALKVANQYMAEGWDSDLTPKVMLIQGYVQGRLGNLPAAAADYQLVVDHFPASPFAAQATMLMAMAYIQHRQYTPVITQVLSQWNELPSETCRKNPETLFWIGEAHLRLRNNSSARSYYRRFMEGVKPDHPLFAQALDGEVAAFAADKDFAGAINSLQRSIQNAQDAKDNVLLASLTVKMGDVNFLAKNYEAAAGAYKQAENLDPKSPKLPYALYQSGLALYRAEYYKDAVDAWMKTAEAYPRSPQAGEALFRAAKTLADMGQTPQALETFNRIVRDNPKSALAKDARLQIGQTYFNAKEFAKAVETYKTFIQLYPDDPEIGRVSQMLQTAFLQTNGSPDQLEDMIKGQAKTPALAGLYWEQGAKQYNEKQYALAALTFEKLLYEFPGAVQAAQASFYRAECLFLLEKYDDAVRAYDNFIASFPQDAQRGPALFHRAVSLFNKKDYAESAQAFTDFAAAFPQDPQAKNANLNAALSFTRAQDVDRARQSTLRYAQLYPNAEDLGALHLQLGQFLARSGRDPQAVEVYRRMSPRWPEYPEGIYNAAQIEQRLGHPAGEKELYETLASGAAKDNPFRVAGLLRLGDIYLSQRKTAQAKTAFEDARAHAADDASRAAAEQRIKALGGS